MKGWDPLVDVAVLGPLDTRLPPLTLSDGESLPVGTGVLLVGYPGESEVNPQPTVVRGLISRFREVLGVTLIQADASLAGGQSGGALVSEHGELIGISGLSFTEAQFSLSASASDILPYVTRLIAGEATSGLGDRVLRSGGSGRLTQRVLLSNGWHMQAFLIDEPPGAQVDLTLSGDEFASVSAYDVYGGELLTLDKGSAATERGSFGVNGLPHYAVVWQWYSGGGDFSLQSNRRLIPIPDPDDGRQIQVGQSINGALDFPWDRDYFSIQLREGETIAVTARSALGDPYLYVDFEGAEEHQQIFDHDSGRGAFGVDARIVYRAPHTGMFNVVLADEYPGPSGYTITVSRAAPGAALTEALAPAPTPTATAIPELAGPMVVQGWEILTNAVVREQSFTSERNAETGEFETADFVADLFVRCDSSLPDPLGIYVYWYQELAGEVTTLWVDDEPPQRSLWVASVDGKGTFHPDPTVLLAQLLQAQELHVLNLDSAIAAAFNVTGLREAIAALDEWTCGNF